MSDPVPEPTTDELKLEIQAEYKCSKVLANIIFNMTNENLSQREENATLTSRIKELEEGLNNTGWCLKKLQQENNKLKLEDMASEVQIKELERINVNRHKLIEEQYDTITNLQSRLETCEEALHQIDSWAKAYPITVFIEPTKQNWKDADELLKKHGFSMTAMSGANMRHVINGVEKIVSNALNPDKESDK